MRPKDLAAVFRPFVDQVLVDLRDGDRQAHFDAVLATVRGWRLETVDRHRMMVPDHPAGCCDVRLIFVDPQNETSIDFTLSLLAREVHSLTVRPVGALCLEVEVLFRRGSISTVVFGPEEAVG